MALPNDDQRDDYDDGRSSPLPPEPAPARRRGQWTPLKLALAVGTVFGVFAVCMGGMAVMQNRVANAPNRMRSSNNLKEITLGVHGYNDTWDELPYNSYSPDGKPLLSWRVHILPFIEHEALYKRFDLNEPWDSPQNSRLLSQMPSTYTRPADRGKGSIHTYYRGFSSPGAIFEHRPNQVRRDRIPVVGRLRGPGPALVLTGIRDDPSFTLLVVEAGDPVEWTKPDDLDASPGQPFPKMGGMGWRKIFQVAMADGTVRSLKLDTLEDILRALVTHSGGETLPPDWDK